MQYFLFKINAGSHVTFFSVKINGVMYAIGYREPEEYKIIRLFLEIQDVMVKHGHSEMDLIEISVVIFSQNRILKKILF